MEWRGSFKITKTLQKQLSKGLMIMVKVSWQTGKSKTGFQSFILAIGHWDMNPDQDTHQISINMLLENWLNAVYQKVFEN